jgi:hypothetical protein
VASRVVVDEDYGPVLVSLALGGCNCSWLAGCVGFNGMPQLYCWHLRKAQSRFDSAPQELCKLGAYVSALQGLMQWVLLCIVGVQVCSMGCCMSF